MVSIYLRQQLWPLPRYAEIGDRADLHAIDLMGAPAFTSHQVGPQGGCRSYLHHNCGHGEVPVLAEHHPQVHLPHAHGEGDRGGSGGSHGDCRVSRSCGVLMRIHCQDRWSCFSLRSWVFLRRFACHDTLRSLLVVTSQGHSSLLSHCA